MIRLYVTGFSGPIAADSDERTAEQAERYIAAIQGLRVARAKLGDAEGHKATACKQVVDDLLQTMTTQVLIGETADKVVAWQAARAALAAGLEIRVEGDLTAEELTSDDPPGVQEIEPGAAESAEPQDELDAGTLVGEPTDPENMPSYGASLVALAMMAASDGNAGTAVVLSNTIRMALLREQPEDAVLWDDVMQCLFDAFPVNVDRRLASMNALAEEFGR